MTFGTAKSIGEIRDTASDLLKTDSSLSVVEKNLLKALKVQADAILHYVHEAMERSQSETD